MTVKKTQLVAPKAPRLPAPRDEYSAETSDQLNKSLNSYFTAIDAAQSTLLGPTGARFLDFPYAILFQAADQTSASTTAINAVKFPALQEGTGITVVSETRLTVSFPGLYVFSFLLQLKNTDAASRDVYFWLRKNGVDVPYTAHRITSVVGYSRPSLDFTLQLEQSDYVELMWNTTNVLVTLSYSAPAAGPPVIPAIPSSYVSVQFNSAVNSSGTDIPVVPPAPPAPTPSPPAPTPAPGPAPPPPAPAPDPGQDADLTTIFTTLGAGEYAWWYPANDADRLLNSDGTGGTVTTDGTPFHRLTDHSGNSNHMSFPTDDTFNYKVGPPEYCEAYHEPTAIAGMGGSSTGFLAVMAVQFGSGSFNTIFSDMNGASTSAKNGIYLRNNDSSLVLSAGTGSARASVSATILQGASAPAYVLIAWYDNTAHTLNLQVNDGTPVSTSCSSLAAGLSDMSVFANPFADFSFGGWEGWDHLFGRFYGGVMYKNTCLDSTKRSTLMYWAARQAGLTLAGSTSPAPPPPPPPSPTPSPPAPSPGVPSITTHTHRHDLLSIGNFFIEDNRWNAANAGISEGTNAWEFKQEVERALTVGSNGEVAFKVDWYWPRYRQNGSEYDHSNYEVKSFPCAIYGGKPGYKADVFPAYPADDFAVRLPDGVTVPAAPPGAPGGVSGDWTQPGGSVSTATGAGSSGGVLPLTLPVSQLKASLKYAFPSGAPTGRGHLSFDIWLQEPGTVQINGFRNSPITHEIMVPIVNWGNYGNPHTATVPDRDPANFVENVTIGGIVYKVYVWQNKGTNPVTGNYDRPYPASYPGLQYNFAPNGLDGSHTNEETGQGRIGWKFIVLIPNTTTTIAHPQDANGNVIVDIAGILTYLRTKSDTRGTPYIQPNSRLVSVELGQENVYSQGNMTVYDYFITGEALAPPPPPPPPAPPPAPAPGTSPYYPFGSRLDLNAVTGRYPYGIQPTNYTKAQMDARVISCYNGWKANRLKNCPTFVANSGAGAGLAGVTITDGLYDDFAGAGYVSEGMGYALLILVLMAGYDTNAQNLFNRVFKVCRARPAYGLGGTNGRDMMDWKVSPSMVSLGGGYSAMDGDEDMALALLMADRQWGSAGTYNYLQEGKNTIAAMKSIWLSGAGTPRYASQNAARTSDFMPGHFRSYKHANGDTIWDTARTRCATLVSGIVSGFSPVAKLQPGFIYDPDGSPVPAYPGHGQVDGSGQEGTYDSNAIRNPWRFATDYIWSGDATWGTFASNITNWIKNDSGGDPFSTWGQFNLDGSGYAGRYLAGVTAVAAGTGGMASASHQQYLNDMFTAISDNYDSSYYNAEIEVLCLITMSGNWWRPEGP